MRYALLSYTRTRNIGDEIQSIAAWRHLPRVDDLADRDFLGEFRPTEPTKLIVNGWFCHRPHGFDIEGQLHPLLIAVHINTDPRSSHDRVAFAETIRASPRLRTLFARHGPIGARDQPTADFLKALGIPAYVSGCLTLTLERDPAIRRGEAVVVTDVPRPVSDGVRARTERPIVTLDHAIGKYHAPGSAFAMAEKLLASYQSAHLVVTSRLHVALPCLAYDTPVMLVREDSHNPRMSGLSTLAHQFTPEAFLRLPSSAIDQPPDNPTAHLRYRQALLERVRAFLPETASPDVVSSKEGSPSLTVARVWHEGGLKGRAEHSWRWLRRSRIARFAKIPGLH